MNVEHGARAEPKHGVIVKVEHGVTVKVEHGATVEVVCFMVQQWRLCIVRSNCER